jgi:hypothetical protein
LPRAIGATPRCSQTTARAAGVRHVVYLGGLLPKGGAPSLHLSSRAEVGQILRERTPCTERARGTYHRLWLRLVRNGALPNRAATDYDYPALD